MSKPVVRKGRSHPLGATLTACGVNFSLYSKSASAVSLLLFDTASARVPSHRYPMQRTFHYWHLQLEGLKPGQLYGYQVEGPAGGRHRFDESKLLLDPYGRALAGHDCYRRKAASVAGDNTGQALKSVVTDARGYDWGEDAPPRHDYSRSVIYEMHVGGFTRHPSSGLDARSRGTFSGLVEKIPYLQALGVTAVELLPIFAFDQQDAPEGLTNYWGYSPLSLFAIHPGYCRHKDPLQGINEFRDMVKALHKAGIEVILDVVYNHTAEGDADGPTFCWRGIDNSVYYLPDDQGQGYGNYSGCGNAMNANHSVVRRMILDSLRYWVSEMHVDGFRFDLASILARDEQGELLSTPPVLWQIETDPVLAGTKLIAEAWDAGGLYQVGNFIGDRWTEWNGRFRDDVRSFLRAEQGTVEALQNRLLASPDIFAHEGREPAQSINFVTCHDGFTLNDLVSYERKRNHSNGWNNSDGSGDNRSWNCGHEGPTSDPQIEALRLRQIRNFFTLNLLALGTPMLCMGDEFRRSQEGNNNAYCHDTPLSWFDWGLAEENSELRRYVSELVKFRSRLPFYSLCGSLETVLAGLQLEWHGTRLGEPDTAPHSHSIALNLGAKGVQIHWMVSAFWEPLTFELPVGTWRLVLDTSSGDISLDGDQLVPGRSYQLGPRSTAVLVSSL